MYISKNPDLNRKIIRLRNFDYSEDGAYFVTICTHNRANLFGEIRDGKMFLNELGKIVKKCWREIPNHFLDVKLDQFVVMPNHIHGIICIDNWQKRENAARHVGDENFHPLPNNVQKSNRGAKPRSLPSIIRGFKIGVTKWARQNSNIYNVWQRSFYDRIIRDDKETANIQDYILNNPSNWEKDEENLNTKK